MIATSIVRVTAAYISGFSRCAGFGTLIRTLAVRVAGSIVSLM